MTTKNASEEKTETEQIIVKVLEECEPYREPMIKRCIMQYAVGYENANDCVQQALISLYESMLNGKVIDKPLAWLYKVSLNNASKVIRDAARERKAVLELSSSAFNIVGNSPVYNPDFLDEMVSDNQIEEESVRIISSLNDNDKNLYYSHYCCNMKIKDISEKSGVSNSAMKKRHERLKKKIGEAVKETNRNFP